MSKAPSNPPNPPAEPRVYDDEDELSLIDLWNIVWKRKWLWLTLGPLGGVIGIVIAVVSTEIHGADPLLPPDGNMDAHPLAWRSGLLREEQGGGRWRVFGTGT